MKQIFKYLSFLVFIIGAMSFSGTAICSSMTKADFSEGTGTIKFTTKLNTTHISEAIKIQPSTASFEAEVKRYINNHFSVSVNNTPKALTFTGSQVNGETLWVYFEATGISSIQTLKVRNTILFASCPKQFNLVNVAYKGQQKTMNFQQGADTQEIKF